ncbi:MAG: single-stranded DNA-binding protein [Dehalococcoidia bacterium]|nr:single-stranded DNA-binding protein [Dehalococcoidia bacterium]
MASLNKVMLIGNAGRDAELRYMANGTAQASFSLAVNRNLRGPDGEWTQETDWFNVVAWRDLAERLSQTVTKGRQLYVEGRLQVRSWDNDQGVKQYRTEVVANQVLALGRGDGAGDGSGGGSRGGWEEGGRRGSTPSRTGGTGDFGGGPIDPDDLPFE